MAVFELPIRNDSPAYRFQLDLEGAIYFFEFTFNTRMNLWVMDIQNQSQEDLIRGIPIQIGISLLDGYEVDGLPAGTFVCLDLAGLGREPDRETFGQDVKLYYQESVA